MLLFYILHYLMQVLMQIYFPHKQNIFDIYKFTARFCSNIEVWNNAMQRRNKLYTRCTKKCLQEEVENAVLVRLMHY